MSVKRLHTTVVVDHHLLGVKRAIDVISHVGRFPLLFEADSCTVQLLFFSLPSVFNSFRNYRNTSTVKKITKSISV